MNKEQKLDRFAKREFNRNVNSMILKDIVSDSYIAFGKYRLIANKHQYEVRTIDNDFVASFGNKRIAISWCVADKYNQINLAIYIKNLDRKKQEMSSDIQVSKAQADRSNNSDFVEVVLTKLQPKIEQFALLNNELEKCLNLAKYLQLRGFQNETA